MIIKNKEKVLFINKKFKFLQKHILISTSYPLGGIFVI